MVSDSISSLTPYISQSRTALLRNRTASLSTAAPCQSTTPLFFRVRFKLRLPGDFAFPPLARSARACFNSSACVVALVCGITTVPRGSGSSRRHFCLLSGLRFIFSLILEIPKVGQHQLLRNRSRGMGALLSPKHSGVFLRMADYFCIFTPYCAFRCAAAET